MDTALSIDAGAGAETHARGSPFGDSVNSLFTTPTKMAAVPVVLDEHAVRQLKYLGSDGQMHGDVPSPEKRASDSKLLQDEMLAQNQLKHQQTERAHQTNRVQQRTIDLQTKQMDAQAQDKKNIRIRNEGGCCGMGAGLPLLCQKTGRCCKNRRSSIQIT